METRIYHAGTLALVGLALLAGCAQEREPINRVQADVLAKSFFVGGDLLGQADDPEFYSRGYVVGHSMSQTEMTVGKDTGLNRIRWEITEDLLIARRSYQLSPGADNKGVPGSPETNGQVVAAYKIVDHFDIREAYNPTTGETTNVVEENKSDRPWYAREHFRVDWSTNEVVDPLWGEIFFGKIWGDPEITPLTYFVNDPNSEDAPYFELEDGYFDITNRYFMKPGLMHFSWGSIPTCMIYGMITGSATYSCDEQEAHVRFAFWKIPPGSRDFEPLENTVARTDVINNIGGAGNSFLPGYGPPVQQYDPAYGYTDAGEKRVVAHINIWERSHHEIPCNSNADVLENNGEGNGTADQCAAVPGSPGSQCDTITQKCTIPYRDRVIKTKPIWVNREMPLEYQDPLDAAGNPTKLGGAEDVIYSWNQMMKAAVAYSRSTECRRTGGGDRATCEAAYFKPEKVMLSYGAWLIEDPIDPTAVLTMCHNPVRHYDDHDACGPTGATARRGDVRKHMMVDWPYANRAPYGGIVSWNIDPTTGEFVGNTATTVHVYRRAVRIRDTLLVAMGDMSVEEYIEGLPSELYPGPRAPTSLSKALTVEEMQKRLKAIDTTNLAKQGNLAANTTSGPIGKRLEAAVKAKAKLSADPALKAGQALRSQGLLSNLWDTDLESGLVDSQWLAGAGVHPDTPMDQSVLDQTSPLRGLDAAKLEDIRQTLSKRFADSGACYTDIDEALGMGTIVNQSLARYFLGKYGHLSPQERADTMLHELAIESFKGVMLHEFGHSLGLRHQFSSSWDAMNYMPQYWQLRTNEGQALGSCEGKPRDPNQPDSCMGPRYLDPLTADEMGEDAEPRPRLDYFAGTSTMEYQNERFSETAGLGTWDRHMTNAVYGRVLETYDPAVLPRNDASQPADQRRVATRMWTQLTESDLVHDVVLPDDPARTEEYATQLFGTDPFLHSWHYTKLARNIRVFDPGRDCRDATPEEKAKAEWRIVHNRICAPYPRDHAAWVDFLSDNNEEVDETMIYWHTKPKADGTGDQVRWSYRVGESYSDAYLHTNMLDTGADAYELAVNLKDEFDAAYPVSYFRRRNREYLAPFVASRAANYYFERNRSYHWVLANDSLRYLSFGQDVFDSLSEDDNWNRPGVLANAELFNSLARYVIMPQPGAYAPMANDSSGSFDAADGWPADPEFVVKIINGRFVDESYDTGPYAGGSWEFQDWQTRSGFYAEKAYAFLSLCDSRPTLSTISRDNYLDGRGVRLNFRSDLPHAFDRLLGGLLAEDWKALGMWVPAETPRGGEATPYMLDLMAKTAPARPAGAKVVFPNVGYLQQLYASIFSALYARENTDMTLINKMRIFVDGVEGNISDAAFPNPDQQVRFFDPGSGYTYIARRYGSEMIDGKQVDTGIASRMLLRGNELVTLSYEVQRDASGPILDQFGQPALVLDANGQPIPLTTFESQQGHLIRYVGLIDSLRQVGHILGQGPL